MAPGAGARFAYLDWPVPIAFAHRGGALEQPENTMRAFEAAVALGYHHLETDVRTTADGVLVVFHDDDLVRTTGRPGRLGDLAWREVQALRVEGAEPIPTFDELLGAWPDVRLNIDVKEEAAIGPLVTAVRRAGAIERVCPASFDQRRIAAVRQALGPGLCTAMSRTEAVRWVVATATRATSLVPDVPVAQVPRRSGRVPVVTRRSVEAAHRLGIDVHVWTVDDAGEMDELLDLGVDGIMTDRPTLLKQVLERRGQWVT